MTDAGRTTTPSFAVAPPPEAVTIALPGFSAWATLPASASTASSELVQVRFESFTRFSAGFSVTASPSIIRPTFTGNLIVALLAAIAVTGSASSTAATSSSASIFRFIAIPPI